MAMQYYYIDPAAQQVGPAELEQLKKDGITRETLVWKEGMKEWLPAGTVPELQALFAVIPPPVKKSVPPALPAASSPLKKFLLPAAGVLVLIIIGAILFFRSGNSGPDDNKQANTDSSLVAKNDTVVKEEPLKTDTVKLVDLDSLASNLNWDTAARTETTVQQNNTSPSFLPGFGNDAPTPSSKSKKATAKKTTRNNPGQKNEQREERTDEPERKEPVSINPVKYLSITGSFRKNLVLEAILEGIIQNRYSAQMRDIVIEVRFLDASGQTAGTKRFTRNGVLAAGSSGSFRFRTTPPKGTKGAKYEIVGASLK